MGNQIKIILMMILAIFLLSSCDVPVINEDLLGKTDPSKEGNSDDKTGSVGDANSQEIGKNDPDIDKIDQNQDGTDPDSSTSASVDKDSCQGTCIRGEIKLVQEVAKAPKTITVGLIALNFDDFNDQTWQNGYKKILSLKGNNVEKVSAKISFNGTRVNYKLRLPAKPDHLMSKPESIFTVKEVPDDFKSVVFLPIVYHDKNQDSIYIPEDGDELIGSSDRRVIAYLSGTLPTYFSKGGARLGYQQVIIQDNYVSIQPIDMLLNLKIRNIPLPTVTIKGEVIVNKDVEDHIFGLKLRLGFILNNDKQNKNPIDDSILEIVSQDINLTSASRHSGFSITLPDLTDRITKFEMGDQRMRVDDLPADNYQVVGVPVVYWDRNNSGKYEHHQDTNGNNIFDNSEINNLHQDIILGQLTEKLIFTFSYAEPDIPLVLPLMTSLHKGWNLWQYHVKPSLTSNQNQNQETVFQSISIARQLKIEIKNGK